MVKTLKKFVAFALFVAGGFVAPVAAGVQITWEFPSGDPSQLLVGTYKIAIVQSNTDTGGVPVADCEIELSAAPRLLEGSRINLTGTCPAPLDKARGWTYAGNQQRLDIFNRWDQGIWSGNLDEVDGAFVGGASDGNRFRLKPQFDSKLKLPPAFLAAVNAHIGQWSVTFVPEGLTCGAVLMGIRGNDGRLAEFDKRCTDKHRRLRRFVRAGGWRLTRKGRLAISEYGVDDVWVGGAIPGPEPSYGGRQRRDPPGPAVVLQRVGDLPPPPPEDRIGGRYKLQNILGAHKCEVWLAAEKSKATGRFKPANPNQRGARISGNRCDLDWSATAWELIGDELILTDIENRTVWRGQLAGGATWLGVDRFGFPRRLVLIQ
ncbi:MAG: hypothetical protein AAFW83_12930 [Pseudomonadota bacterium]